MRLRTVLVLKYVFSGLNLSKQLNRLSVSSCRGSTIQLNCSFDKANPKPVIKWYKSSRLLGSSEDLSPETLSTDALLNQDSVDHSIVALPSGKLEISNVSDSNGGKYLCFGQNIAGKKKGFQYTLTVTTGKVFDI